jgi:trans-AT polyketide synthase/acyltransferase/oxidoreductase domain-containing protein
MLCITPESLGDPAFKMDYKIPYAYLAGAMYKGIASQEMIVKLGQANLMGFLGTGGMRLEQIEECIQFIQAKLTKNQSYGMNLLSNTVKPALEDQTVDLFLRYGIRYIEAAAFIQITQAIVRYRLKGVRRNKNGVVEIPNFVLAKVSRPEVAKVFMSPAPSNIIQKLLLKGDITEEEARLGEEIPLAHDICVESDSGGHTDQRVALTMVPAILRLRDQMMQQYHYAKKIRIGAAGGIGTPEAAAACFTLGADFILTGSINQCTVEAGISDAVKNLLQEIEIQDTTYAPAGDMFELGARVQVVKKGLLFPARANKLYELYRFYNALDDLDENMLNQLQERYFRRSIADVWNETKAYYLKEKPSEIEKAEKNTKHKLALIFRWYFIHTMRLSLTGDLEQPADYQIHCGSALGAFNQWVKGTSLENWRNRHVDEIAHKLMSHTAEFLTAQLMHFSVESKKVNQCNTIEK